MHPEDLLTILCHYMGEVHTLLDFEVLGEVKSPFQLLIIDGSKKSQYSKIKGFKKKER